jgi:hypothetical protein
MKHNNTAKWMALIIAALLCALMAQAHNGMEHVIGTVKAMTGSVITVETPQHQTVMVLVDATTKFTHSDAASSMKELHVGERVVIHAKANAEKKLVGVTVQWGATGAGH